MPTNLVEIIQLVWIGVTCQNTKNYKKGIHIILELLSDKFFCLANLDVNCHPSLLDERNQLKADSDTNWNEQPPLYI